MNSVDETLDDSLPSDACEADESLILIENAKLAAPEETEKIDYVDISSCVEATSLNTSDEVSPSGNTSRYGRARKQKTINDFYPTDLLVFNEKKLYMKPSPSKYVKKSPHKALGRPPKNNSTPKSSDNINFNSNTDSTQWNGIVKPPGKVYVKKDLTQKKSVNGEETGNILRNMFSPIKTESPEKDFDLKPVINVYKPKKPKINLDSLFPNNHNDQIRPISPILIKKEIEDPSYQDYAVTEQEALCKFKLGDLVWARVGTYPFWPGLITRDPESGLFVKSKVVGRCGSPTDAVHLSFFADSGRHSWLSIPYIILFTGLDDYNQIKAELTSEIKKKDPKYFKAFSIPANQKSRWLSAVSEAEMLFRRPPETREDFFRTVFLTSPIIYKATRKTKAESTPTPNSSFSESLFDSLLSESNIELNNSIGDTPLNKKPTHMERWLMKAKKLSKGGTDSSFSINDESDFKKSKKRASVEKKVRKRSKQVNESQDDASILKKIKCEDTNLTSENFNENIIIKTEPTDISLSNTVDEDKTEESEEIPKRVLRSREPQSASKSNGSFAVTQSTESVKSNSSDQKESKSTPKTPKTNSKYNNPDFQDFVELQRDCVEDQFPELSENEIMEFLYKTWQYEEGFKANEAKEIDDFCAVKGMDEDDIESEECFKVKKPRQSKTSTDIKQESIPPLNKELRKKTIKSYFCDNYDSSDDDFEKSMKASIINKSDIKTDTVQKTKKASEKIVVKIEPKNEPVPESEPAAESQEDIQDQYMLSLSRPKPNIFKGLPKDKVCEICEEPYNLLKCKGLCGGTYHLECVKKQSIPLDSEIKKKKRGRKSLNKSSVSETEENSNSSDDKNKRNEINHDDFITVDESEFEAMATAKMQELLESSSQEYPDDLSESSLEEMTNKKLEQTFKCQDCQTYDTPLCFICKKTVSPKTKTEERQRCSVTHCCKYYHLDCLKLWPQTKYNATASVSKNNKKVGSSMETLFCPRHVCHTCVCDDPQGSKTRFSGDKLARCIRCPATYHSFTQCIPAGTTLLSFSHIICPRHITYKMGKIPYHVNTAWCFICAKGGTLICCETCPTSFHAECLNIPLPEGGYICEDCETGRLPLYGEIVWVKFGHYRWWPALVLHPCDIPANLYSIPHSMGQFAVRFFGGYDYYWVSGGRVFPYQEGDTGQSSSRKNSLDQSFVLAVKQAEEAFKIIKNIKAKKAEGEFLGSLLPPQYIKLKVNRAVGGAVALCKSTTGDEAASKCDCDPNTEFPCSADSDCLNRMLLTECSPNVCAAGKRCCNQQFEKRIYPPLAPTRTSARGWGLSTLTDLKQGDFIIEYVGEVIDEVEFQRRMSRKEEMRDENYYFLTLDKDRMIDAGPKGNVARFMNHSCEPNCETQKWTVNGDIRVGLFALRDIVANEELTFNYNLSSVGDVKKSCLCGAPRCGGYMGAKVKPDEPPPKKIKTKLKRKYRKKTVNGIPIVKLKTESEQLTKSNNVLKVEIERLEKNVINSAINNGSSNTHISKRKYRKLKKNLKKMGNNIANSEIPRVKRKYVKKKKPVISIDLIENYCKEVPAQKDSIEDDLMLINGTKIIAPTKKIKLEKIHSVNGYLTNGDHEERKSEIRLKSPLIKTKRRSSSVHFCESVTLITDEETKVAKLNDSNCNGVVNGYHNGEIEEHVLETCS